MGPGGFFSRTIQTLPTFWAICMLILVVVVFGSYVGFQISGFQVHISGFPDFQNYGQLNGIEYFAGFVVAFYVLSATVLAGKIGVANFFMAVTGQTMSSKIIDHFGFLGAPIWPINLSQALGAVVLLAGLIITQVTNGK